MSWLSSAADKVLGIKKGSSPITKLADKWIAPEHKDAVEAILAQIAATSIGLPGIVGNATGLGPAGAGALTSAGLSWGTGGSKKDILMSVLTGGYSGKINTQLAKTLGITDPKIAAAFGGAFTSTLGGGNPIVGAGMGYLNPTELKTAGGAAGTEPYPAYDMAGVLDTGPGSLDWMQKNYGMNAAPRAAVDAVKTGTNGHIDWGKTAPLLLAGLGLAASSGKKSESAPITAAGVTTGEGSTGNAILDSLLASAKFSQAQSRKATVSGFTADMERRNLTGSPLYFKMLAKLNADMDAAETAQGQGMALDVFKAVSANDQAYNLANFNAQQQAAQQNAENKAGAWEGAAALLAAYYNSQQQKKMLTAQGA